MPSPFPGMDPYLEGDDWTSFHTHFATEIARQLTPLLAGDPDVPLDLQGAFQNVYDLCGFDLVLDYSRLPRLPFEENQAAWVAELLRTAKRG